ncbi:MAG TPA: DUF3035 domain-containing protein [Stellaceae bacterium]|nr:DUF3035 domain-containing protein [Stellaceae bacterium]
MGTRFSGAILAAAALMVSLGGCTDMRRALGMEKVVPDEFAVVSRAPLAIPPEYTLRPPRPGAPPTQEVSAPDAARNAVFRSGEQQASLPPAAGERSPGEGALLREAGATDVDPTIRQRVTDEASGSPADEKGFVDKLLFWQSSGPPPTNQVIDPAKEAERLKVQQANGKPPPPDTTVASPPDQQTPTIERKKSTSVFNPF